VLLSNISTNRFLYHLIENEIVYLKVDRKCQNCERAMDKISTLISNVSKFKDPDQKSFRNSIESVANERNMSESSSKESSSKREPKRRFTDSERKHRKRESNAKFKQDMDWRPV
jgi:hypothetical protein